MAVISSINKWQGYTVGASRVVSHVAGSLSKHRKIIHEVRLAETHKKVWTPHQLGVCLADSARLASKVHLHLRIPVCTRS